MIFSEETFFSSDGYLVLSDGTFYEIEILSLSQKSYAGVVALGEVVFNTVLTGYQEVVTDPSYAGQFITFTTPEIGNYGCNFHDMESDRIWANAVAIRNYSGVRSNYRGEKSLLALCEESNVPLIQGLDTRALTRHIREHGAMPGVIGVGDPRELAKFATSEHSTDNKDLAAVVTRGNSFEVGEGPLVVAIDYGMKSSIIRYLAGRFRLRVVPATTSGAEILSYGPAGVFLSNGPGDPSALTYSNSQITEVLGKVPLFGICLGHQLLARAIGATTYKLNFGHHGGNHPVSRLSDQVVEITSQNHNYAVDRDSLSLAYGKSTITHVNLNDNVVEGFSLDDARAFSVQYHPEASPGPHDSLYLFDLFAKEVRSA
ncbi:glutamine-hydrolyzing carbamoyl-phosphate synthase small subunit [Acidithrix ferrooxidans]|uniref:Carbamoyl phosphate synthase small chain n=1 Tax=Acidithrix ferrooxidans TaxID=1280514 RepID=A0A0D8HFU0_9ACTN|nr:MULTISPECIES: glutamine-hydrolyzing carbamoyl-phosphate synthase small subunit [Acidithrix]KJF16793.1 carbamoyl-phosphate synthase small chain [Acidithrix ferrooxidans]